MSEFKVGDRVRVVRKVHHAYVWWTALMDERIGDTGEIIQVTTNGCFYVKFDDGNVWFFHPDSLELEPAYWQPGFYRQRDGAKCEIIATLTDEQSERAGGCRYIGLDDEGDVARWGGDGEWEIHHEDYRLDIIGPWVDEPNDAEIADAMRYARKHALGVDGNGVVFEGFAGGRTIREYVDAINEYRKQHPELEPDGK